MAATTAKPRRQSLVDGEESDAASSDTPARPRRQCTIKNNENKETTKKNNVGHKQAKTTSSKQKKEEGQMTRGGVDLALVSKEYALKMAENKELSQRNYKFLGTRFNFGRFCVDSANNCKCSSTGVLNACLRTNAIKALTEGAVAGEDCKLNTIANLIVTSSQYHSSLI